MARKPSPISTNTDAQARRTQATGIRQRTNRTRVTADGKQQTKKTHGEDTRGRAPKAGPKAKKRQGPTPRPSNHRDRAMRHRNQRAAATYERHESRKPKARKNTKQRQNPRSPNERNTGTLVSGNKRNARPIQRNTGSLTGARVFLFLRLDCIIVTAVTISARRAAHGTSISGPRFA